MTIETIVHYLHMYGYVIIFLSLFFGIIGIPAPEESLLVLIGIACIPSELSLGYGVLSAFLGTFIGMIVAYLFGKQMGHSIVQKYGRFVGLTETRWMKVQEKYKKNIKRTVIFGLYLPGIRQINPYFAGATHVKFSTYLWCSFIGSILWTIPYIIGGYYLGSWFDIPLNYVSFFGFIFLFIFICSTLFKMVRKKIRNQLQGQGEAS
ncbi:DedA family protein [Sporosarcina limicola]|uniref:Membrane protein DedA with SNARE-associated domain n=1 Tax=Sporosarcina limicola TaxID=34101 RepID=A0A927MJX9_9BACL|nr:DedA family protein [Sporosarcina limicola]MBE1556085.1 membrane protein DedA with SNARE-associated domain [Sporosarcina limicola]